MLYQVSETFYSLQGEGYWTGTPACFLRLAGCNLRCPWCDTDHAPRETLSETQLLERARALSGAARRLVVTGGEPTLQPLQPLVDCFQRDGWFVAIETNGTGPLPAADWITVSPKAGVDYPATLRGDELKIVLDGVIDPARFLPFPFAHRFIQPCSRDYAPAVRYVLDHPLWRLSIQTHLVLDIP